MPTSQSRPQIEGPAWDLSDLFAAPDDPRIDALLKETKRDADAFADAYKGRLAELSAAPAAIAEAIQRYESIQAFAAKPGNYSHLLFAANSSPENGAFFQKIREQLTEATLPLIFFDVELTRLPATTLESLADAPALANYRHYLQTVRTRAAYSLSEAEERILEEKSNTGRRAFVRLYEEITANLRFTLPGQTNPQTLSEIVDLQYSSDRTLRQTSAEALTAGLASQERTLTFLFNTLMQDKATEDRLRGYTYSEQARHMANELHLETVETVVRTAEKGFPLVARYYEAKRKLLGLEKLAHYDRYAPILADEPAIAFDEAENIVLSAFDSFHPEYCRIAKAFFENGWIDGAARPGKRGGAFCAYITPDIHPYIFLNYMGKAGDVRTLAHELGHGIHSYLSRGQSNLNYHGTLPMAEVASTFAEMVVFQSQQEQKHDNLTLLALYANQIDQAVATIFRQAALYRFEQAIHAERRNGELSSARIGEIWQQQMGAMFAGAVEMEPGHSLWWTYIRHFVATPFYVYAYTFGEMLAYALFTRLQATGTEAFAPSYLDLLRQGGSRSPEELVAPLGVDLNAPDFWEGALAAFESQVTRFEELSAQYVNNTGS